MNKNLIFATSESPRPSHEWITLTEDQRLSLVRNILKTKMPTSAGKVEIIFAREDGQIIVRLIEEFSADKRGTLLLDIEEIIKHSIDNGLVVWLEALNDTSPLRRLRGIGVKS